MVFVQKEIDDLVALFDDVVVFCHARDTSAGMVELPDGVRYGGNLFEPAPEDAPRRLLEWGPAWLFLVAAWEELRSGRLFRHPVLFVLSSKVGITQAHRTAVREAIAGADDVVAYGFWAMGGGLGVPWLRGIRARVTRTHGYDLYEERMSSGYLPFRPFMYRRADRVLTISEDGSQYLRRNYRQSRGKIALSRLGVYGPERAPRHPSNPFWTIVSCSSVSELKRVGLILEAVCLLSDLEGARPVRWVHFGGGPLLAEIQEAVRGAPEGVTIELRGHVDNADVLDFYARERVDVFVNASTTEGVPVSIMEAISYGIPTVATAVGGTPEIVGPQLRTGELLGADPSPKEIAESLLAVLNADEGTYTPRELWEREYDARRTGAYAAGLVSTAGR
ncbi:glycosyltransferase [Microbacterium bovistercoris]|uniref:glycosyltransferase n=1 Tax=Microbacterium bovistercoris TaxID=2293570 RepID=UPI0011C05A83|nr:glycosyltransferase [Microbacterium bovistercoris]